MTDARWMLPHEASSAREARVVVHQFLSDVTTDAVDHDAALLVVSELVTNAVLHCNDTCELIELRAHTSVGALHIEVHDHDPAAPAKEAPSESRHGGRGLSIVDEMASDWGWEPVDGEGKRVWCELRPPRP